jgi:hypothetical protein
MTKTLAPVAVLLFSVSILLTGQGLMGTFFLAMSALAPAACY